MSGRAPIKQKNVLVGLIVLALIGAGSGSTGAGSAFRFGNIIEDIQARGSMQVGIGLFEPWVMCNTAGGLIGFEVEVADKIAKDMEVELELVPTYWPRIIPDLIDEEFDVIISGMTITATRTLRVNFTAPTAESGLWIVANRSKTQGLSRLEDVNTPSVSVAVRGGSAAQTFVENRFPRAKLLLFDAEDAILRATLSGDAHIAAVYAPTPTRWLEEYPTVLHRPFEQVFYRRPEAIALRKGDMDGLNFFNSWIAVHQANGWLDERRRYWFETRGWADQLATDARVIAQCAASFD